jgi:hypothetical protein
MSKEAMKLALEALQECRRDPRLKYEHPTYDKAIKALEEELAKQEQSSVSEQLGEPVTKDQWWVKELEGFWGGSDYQVTLDTRRAAKTALSVIFETTSQPKQEQSEPVAWLYHDAGSLKEMLEAERKCLNIHSVLLSIRRYEAYRNETPLYTTPQQRDSSATHRTWVGLDWSDLPDEWVGKPAFMEGAKWAESKLKGKNT